MRTCKVFKKIQTINPITGKLVWETTLESEAVFHCFSQDYEEFESGPGNFPAALVEFPDGSLASRHVDFVRFDEPTHTLKA